MKLSIFNLRFQLKKENKRNINKYTKQCTHTKAITNFDPLMYDTAEMKSNSVH